MPLPYIERILFLAKGEVLFITLISLAKADINEMRLPIKLCMKGIATGIVMTMISSITINKDNLLIHLKE